MQSILSLLAVALALPFLGAASSIVTDHHPHHRHHKHKHHRHQNATHNGDKKAVATQPKSVVQAGAQVESSIVEKMKKLEAKLSEKAKAQSTATQGHLLVNGPIPADFSQRFAQSVNQATGADRDKVNVPVKVIGTTPLEDNPGIVEVAFSASPSVVKEVETEAADPESKLAQGNMRPFLVAKEPSVIMKTQPDMEEDQAATGATQFTASATHSQDHGYHKVSVEHAAPQAHSMAVAAEQEVTPVQEKGIDIDTAMPYGDLEPFGREDTAQELTESSVKESDEMVDQLERAEVAEEKRAVFRALTRLRGAAITSFDGVARSQTGNIDEYNKVHKWRKTHPLHHLADEESDVSKWAFPDNADF